MPWFHVTGYDHPRASFVGSFVANLPEMLGAMAIDPRCLIAVAEFADGRYVQFWVTREGAVVAEVVSNLNIGEAVALSDVDEMSLREMGWRDPAPGPNPNWRVECSDATGLGRVVEMTRRVVYEVLGERPDGRVTLRSWTVKVRASPAGHDQLERARRSDRERLAPTEVTFDGD